MNWKEKLANKWYGLKVADNAIQVDNNQRRQKVVEHSIEQAYRVARGDLPEVPDFGEEDMAVSVGDNTTYNIQQPSSSKSSLPTWAKVAAGIALGAGLAGPVGSLASTWLNPNTPAPVVDTDTNTEYEFGIGLPK